MDVRLIPVNQVQLDYKNPRIARALEMYDPTQINSSHVALALGAGDSQEGETYASFHSLKEAIRTHGGLIQPILVNELPDGTLMVIEGNTRLQIFRDFIRDRIPGNWERIPAIVHKNLDAQAIDAIRLQAHLVGPRPWDPYSKARYLDSLRNCAHMTFEQLVEFCGGRRRQVSDFIQAYRDMEAFYRPALPQGDTFDTTRFSAFVEVQRPNVQCAIVEASFTKTDFAKWVIDGLLGRQENVRQLPRILRNAAARETFLQDGAQEALKLLEVPPADANLENATLVQLARELQRRLAHLQWQDYQRLKADPMDADREALADAKALLDEILGSIAGDELG